jgi:hypothetical protein
LLGGRGVGSPPVRKLGEFMLTGLRESNDRGWLEEMKNPSYDASPVFGKGWLR